jgi:hypothetical protein
MKRKGRGFIQGAIPEFGRIDSQKNHKKKKVTVAGLQVEIKTQASSEYEGLLPTRQ